MNIAQAYEKVNAVKPVGPIVALTLEQAERAVRKMYRHLSGNKFPYRVIETSGNRVTWLYRDGFRVNVGNGWSELIHLFSHWYYGRYVGGRPHSKTHARIELKLRVLALKRGWMNGSLQKPEPVPELPAPDAARTSLIEKRREQIKRLERKIKALTTRAIRAKRSLAALERYAAKRSDSGNSMQVAAS